MPNKAKLALLVSLIICSCLLYLPILLKDLSPINIAQFLGLCGLQLVWWQLVLGNRPINRIFGEDLISINNIHKFLGKYGFLIVLLHPVFMTIHYGISLIIPPISFDGSFARSVSFGKIGITLLIITWLISAFYRTRLSWMWWKRIHLLPYFALPLLFPHALGVGSDLQKASFYKFWVLGLSIAAGLILVLRLADWSGLLKLKYKVIKKRMVARNVTRFQLVPVQSFIKPKKGQFAYFQMKRFGKSHPFTVSHFDDSTHEISFSIKAVGPYSRQLTELRPGDTVFVEGSFGVFTRELENKQRPVIFVAGGIGITPFIRWLEAKKVDYLFYGAQTSSDIAYLETAQQSGAQVFNVLSSERKPGYEKGYVSVDFIESKIPGNLTDYDYFICGPPPMMYKIAADLISNKVSVSQLHTERFSL